MISFNGYDLGEHGDVDTFHGFRDDLNYIRVTCCGYFKYMTVSSHIKRPAGMRQDYQLLYIMQGKMTHYFDGKPEYAGRGSLVMYPPLVPNDYFYDHRDTPEVYWVHFTGTGAEECVRRLGFHNCRICDIGHNEESAGLFQKIIEEMQLQTVTFRQFAAAYFLLLTARMERQRNILAEGHKDLRNEKIWKALDRMHRNPANPLSIEEYADECLMSPSWFVHSFKRLTGKSPLQYQAEIRIGQAREMLTGTALSVSEIASMLSYNDIYSFSKAFKKQTGKSPLQFRKNSRTS